MADTTDTNMDFQSLLQQAEKLTNETKHAEEFPRVERTLPQVLQAMQDLHTRVTQTEVQPRHLPPEYDLKIKLEKLSSAKTFEPLEPIPETDIQSFLKNERENAILSVIEEVRRNTYQEAQREKWNRIFTGWSQEKVKLLNALVDHSQNWIDITKVPEQTILNETSSALNHLETSYFKIVEEYNKLVISGEMRPNLVQKFSSVAETFSDSKVAEIWKIMKYMLGSLPVTKNRSPPEARNQMFPLFVDQAKKYLEKRYEIYMNRYISERYQDALKGGHPNRFNLVKSFVRLKFSQNVCFGLEDGTIEGNPFWPMVYYCLRCGNINSALECLRKAGSHHEDLTQVLEDYCIRPEQRISVKLETQLKIHYKRQIKNSTDPYKKAVYCIIGSCDLTEPHAEIANTTDDFLWIKLSLVRFDLSADSEILSYLDLQKMILDQYGEKHFHAAEKPHIYFQFLALTGQFEAAIEFLSRFEKYRPHAVHMALALNEMCLIAAPLNVQAPLLFADIDDVVPTRRLNIARLVMLYVKKFEIVEPSAALNYFFFLRDMRDPDGRNLFLTSLTDLAIECRNYDLIFGKMLPNGTKTKGLIDDYKVLNIDYKAAAKLTAEELVKKGMFEDAIRLFDIAGDYTQALKHTAILLSQVVHQKSKPGSIRERLYTLSSELSDRHESNKISCEIQTLNTFEILRELLEFFNLYHDGKYERALEVLDSLKTRLIPLRTIDVETCINNFKRLSGEVCKVFPDLLLATMDILYSKYKDLKLKGATEHQLLTLRESAKAITNMAATVPYRMPGDTNSRLIQVEILMH